MRKEATNAVPEIDRPSVSEELDRAEALIESSHYKEARQKLQKISQAFQIPIISQESYRFHYLRGLLFFRLGEHPAAWEETEEALRVFKAVNTPISLPERENLPDFVIDNLRKLRDIEVALMVGLQEPDGNWRIVKDEKLTERIVELSFALDNLKPLAKLHFLVGYIQIHSAKLGEAIEHLERAATGFKLSRDWQSLARTLSALAHIHCLQGDLGPAIQLVEQARTYGLKAGDRYFETLLRSNLAHIQNVLGLWRPALSSLPEVLAETEKIKDLRSYATTLLMWSYGNLLRGHFKECRKSLDRALRICTDHNLTGCLKLTHGHFSELCLATGQFEEAEKHLKKALEIARRVTPGGSTETQAWRVLGDVFVAQKKFKKAQKAYATCQSCLAKLPEKLEEGAMYRGMGTVNAHQKQLQVARRDFKKALDIFEACNNQWEKAKTFVVAAESGVFTQAEMEPDIAWAKDVFKRLEHPAWVKRARALLKKAKNFGQLVPLPIAHEKTEREQIVNAVLSCNGNITQAAKKLGLLRQTLQYKIRHYGIKV